MPLTGTLDALGRLLRRTPPPPDDVLEAYAHEVVPVLDRAEWLYQYWLDQSTLFTDSEKLGNVAAIHRWETASMGRSLERVIPPAVLARAHESVLDALDMASRAAQLLSSGSRFHNANAICEGQALLVQSRDRRLAALQSMRRYLAAVLDAPAGDDRVDGHTPRLTEAAALVSADADAVQAASEQAAQDQSAQDQSAQGQEGQAVTADTAEHSPAAAVHSDGWAETSLSDVAAQPQATSTTQPAASAAPQPSSSEPSMPVPPATAPSPAQPVPVNPEARSGSGWGSLFRRPSAPPEAGAPPE